MKLGFFSWGFLFLSGFVDRAIYKKHTINKDIVKGFFVKK